MTILNPDDPIMIGLYYCYLDMQNTLAEHLKFQEKLCKDLSLFGRIRVSPEGINGVLSGSSSNLKEYERFLSMEIEDMLSKESDVTFPTRYGNTLDIKYCHLRQDIPIEKQVFTNLSIKATKEVVSLNDGSVPNSSQSHKRRGRNKQRNNEVHDTPVINVKDFEPAIHLTPHQWNQELMQSQNDSDAILIDARNCYESAVGHFKVDGLPTLLTNTRKYSTISDVLKANANNLSGKKVMMYCTGGVRCERASSYLLALAESDEWPKGLDKPKAVYQLQGGIQKYLEAFGTTEDGSRPMLKHNPDKESHDTTGPCLYAGRNFVFDPRRIDPVVGISGKAVGRCVLCLIPHDDYDNGSAPSEEKEARCCRCRVLVLVCNTCRERVRIWGEEKSTPEDSKPDLYCGGKGECMNEGNAVEHCTLVQY